MLTLIFQASLKQGQPPSDWKHANITPIFKKGVQSAPVNYRPISLTCKCCKALEHIICFSIHAHLEENKILSNVQHGFRKRRSCETQLITTIDDLAQILSNNHGGADVILLDFPRLLIKYLIVDSVRSLHFMVSEGHALLTWIINFLINRTQCVVLIGQSSQSSNVLSESTWLQSRHSQTHLIYSNLIY